MSKKENKQLAARIVKVHAKHTVEPNDIGQDDDGVMQQKDVHVYRLVDVLGYTLVGVDEDQSKAFEEVAEVIEKDLNDEVLSVSSDWITANT